MVGFSLFLYSISDSLAASYFFLCIDIFELQKDRGSYFETSQWLVVTAAFKSIISSTCSNVA